MNSVLELVTSILECSIRIATPLGYASLAELLLEKSGIRNLSLDGLMLLSALVGFISAYYTSENLLIGFIAGILTGISAALFFGFVVIKLKVESNIAGMILAILYSGISLATHRLVFKEFASPPSIKNVLSPLSIPLLSNIPVLNALFNQPIFTLLLFLIIFPLTYYFLEKTFYGLKIKAIGMDFVNAKYLGVPVIKFWLIILLIHGALAGIGGALYTLCLYNMYLDGITGGAGWLAIAFAILGNWKTLRMLLSLMLFALVDSIQLRLMAMGIVKIPHQFLLMMPFIFAFITLTVVAVIYKRIPEPASLRKGLKEL
ncbi:MAG: ABC transporter permease [Thermofilaceae archaeon]